MKKPGKIAIGSDHGGYRLKEALKRHLERSGYEVEDFGTHSERSVDYPDYALKVAEAVGRDGSSLTEFPEIAGIIVCRSAAGVVIAANKVKGVRAVAAFDKTSAEHSRSHNAANVLGLSGDWLSTEEAKEIVKLWLATPFSMQERHVRRLKKIADYES